MEEGVEFVVDSCEKMGAMAWQGPHHVAWKSATTTGVEERRARKWRGDWIGIGCAIVPFR